MRKSGIEASGDEETKTDPHGGVGKTKIDLQRVEVTQGPLGSTLARAAATISTLVVHPLDSLSIPSPIRGTT